MLDSEEVSVFESFEDVQLENQYYYGRKYFHRMYSDPNNADTDGDGIIDRLDDNPNEKDIGMNLFFVYDRMSSDYTSQAEWMAKNCTTMKM